MNLYLLRHGLAVELGTPGYADDAARPLTPEGQRKLRKVAAAMKRLELKFDRILSSPYLRARQTAEVVAAALSTDHAPEFSPELAPRGSSKRLLGFIRQLQPTPEDVLLVGHEPAMSQLISLVVWGDTGGMVVMKKAGLCKLSAATLHHGRCAVLEWLLTPKQMVLMA